MDHGSEIIERAEMEALHGLADAATRKRLGLALHPVGDGVASVAAALPASAVVVNRVLGSGLTRAFEPGWIGEAAARYRAAGVGRFFFQLHPDARVPGIARHFAAAGLERARSWQKFERGRDEPIEARPSGLTVREVGPEHGADFARIVCAAFDLGGAAEPWMARVPGSAAFQIFMSFEGETPAGCGGVFIRGDEAWTDFGATAPSMRGRGAQGANLAARVRFALERGCRRIHTCTGEAVPGEPQHSYHNILRCGFRETYLRENYAPPRGESRA